ncbi:MAG: GAF domain-containing protein [Terriglobales bacterium]|jgi:hypothetical protein
MQVSASKPSSTGLTPPGGRDRRRRMRHRVHTPAYASLNQPQGAMLDLCPILDLSEEGMCLQSSVPLETNRRVQFFLDLSETKSRIPVSGMVIWSDRAGRAGIRFENSPETPLSDDKILSLKEWLFVNALTAWMHNASSQTAATTTLRARNAIPARAGDLEAPSIARFTGPDYTGMLAAIDAVKREVEALGPKLDSSLRLIAERAAAFTQASGAAIAIADVDAASISTGVVLEMTCRARAGADAPSLGARLQVGTGFSGECVRTGKLLRCSDTEIDPRVDQASCRALGIRSLAAVPIRSGNFVAGLLEVFSPAPQTFDSIPSPILLRLADVASLAIHRAAQAMVKAHSDEEALQGKAAEQGHSTKATWPIRMSPSGSSENDPDVPALFESSDARPLSPVRRTLLFAVALTLILVVVWLIETWPSKPRPLPIQPTGAASAPKSSSATPLPVGIDGLRQLATQGDPSAQFALGVHYATGEDVPQDYGEAVRWFTMAAEQGQVMAQATLGAYYWAGRGVPQDLQKAYFWAMLAQAGGDEASKVRVAFLSSRMTRPQILAAQQRADVWIKERQLVSSATLTK